MKKGEIYEGVIEKVDFPNKGYVNIDGEKVIVKNGIPGQKVRFMINKKRSGRVEGRLLEVLEKSPLEVREPVCSIFPACGGCMYQTMSYEEQLKMKENQVKSLLQAAVGEDVDLHWEGIHGSPIEFGYRNKMEFSFGDEFKDGPLSLGLHKKGSTYDVLTASDCKLVHPDMTAILSCVLDFFTELGAVHYKKMQHTGYLRHLLVHNQHLHGPRPQLLQPGRHIAGPMHLPFLPKVFQFQRQLPRHGRRMHHYQRAHAAASPPVCVWDYIRRNAREFLLSHGIPTCLPPSEDACLWECFSILESVGVNHGALPPYGLFRPLLRPEMVWLLCFH